MYSLEVPEVHNTDYDGLQKQAAELIEADYAGVREGREIVSGVLFCQKDGYSEVGVSSGTKDNGDLVLDLHLPHFEALVPPNSPLDELMRCSYLHNNTQAQEVSVPFWSHQFSSAARSWPSLTVSVPLSHDSSGDLEIGRPETAETLFEPTLQVAGRVKESLDHEEAEGPGGLLRYLTLAQQLAAQRQKHGAFEIYHEGRLWQLDKDKSDLTPMSHTDFVMRELLLVGGISVGRWLKSQQQEALYVSHNHKSRLASDEIQALVGEYFAGNLGGFALWSTLATARGRSKLTENPGLAFNNNVYGGPVANLHTRLSFYSHVINMRIAGNQAVRPGSPLYSSEDLNAYTAQVHDMEVMRKRTGAYATGELTLQKARLKGLTSAEMATLDSEQFRGLYNLSKEGHMKPEAFIQACLARVREVGSIPAIIAIDTLVDRSAVGRKAQELQHALREPMLLYAANNLHEAANILQNSSMVFLVNDLITEPLDDGTMRVQFVWRGQRVSATGETAHEASAKALIKIAGEEGRDITYYQQHDSAAQWRADNEGTRNNPNNNSKHVLNLLARPDSQRSPAVKYRILSKNRPGVTIKVTAQIKGRVFNAVATDRDRRQAERNAAANLLNLYEQQQS